MSFALPHRHPCADYVWQKQQNIIGWLGDCAGRALAIYQPAARRHYGRAHPSFDQAVAAIEAAGRGVKFADLPNVDSTGLGTATSADYHAAQAIQLAWGAVVAAHDSAVDGAYLYRSRFERLGNEAVEQTLLAGVPETDVMLSRWRWIVTDLNGNRLWLGLYGQQAQAAVAAVSIGQFELAREILRGTAEARP